MKRLALIEHLNVFGVVGTMLSIALLVGGCAAGSANQPISQVTPQMHMSTSWAEWYTNLTSLKHASDISAAGSIVGIVQQTVQDGIPYTDFTFHVSQVLYDPHHLFTGQSLLIHQTGGLVNNRPVSVESDPLFQIGEQAVLFLKQYSPGHYFVAGGPSGRFRIVNHQVTPITTAGVSLNWPVADSTFFTLVQQA